jgi:hypothetical protein
MADVRLRLLVSPLPWIGVSAALRDRRFSID